MSYNFSAEKRGGPDLKGIRVTLSHFVLFEIFTVEVSEDSLILGISIPLKSVDDPRFENELEELMRYLVVRQGFNVIDLYSGSPVLASNISDLAKKIAS